MNELLVALQCRPAQATDLDALRAELARLDGEEDALAGKLDTLRRQIVRLRQLLTANLEPLPECGVVSEKVVVAVKRKRGGTLLKERRGKETVERMRAALAGGNRLAATKLAEALDCANKTIYHHLAKHPEIFQPHPGPHYTLYSLRERIKS